jgi:hypothetical protein
MAGRDFIFGKFLDMAARKRYAEIPLQTRWTQQDVIKARAMVAKGMTAREIGRALGRTRNSVIGWMHRQGIKTGVPKPQAKPKTAKVPPAPKPAPKKKIRPLQSARVASFHHFTKDDPQRYEPYQPLVFEDPAPTMRLIDTIGHTQCRWIPNDPRMDETLVCGRETDGRSYCPLHHDIVYPRRVVKPKRIEA